MLFKIIVINSVIHLQYYIYGMSKAGKCDIVMKKNGGLKPPFHGG